MKGFELGIRERCWVKARMRVEGPSIVSQFYTSFSFLVLSFMAKASGLSITKKTTIVNPNESHLALSHTTTVATSRALAD